VARAHGHAAAGHVHPEPRAGGADPEARHLAPDTCLPSRSACGAVCSAVHPYARPQTQSDRASLHLYSDTVTNRLHVAAQVARAGVGEHLARRGCGQLRARQRPRARPLAAHLTAAVGDGERRAVRGTVEGEPHAHSARGGAGARGPARVGHEHVTWNTGRAGLSGQLDGICVA
jgi:hypothetical protein